MASAQERIAQIGVLPVIAIKKREWAEPLAEALQEGGIPLLEATLRTECALACIASIKRDHPQMMVGAGTVLSVEQAKRALDAGADFLVSPGYDPEIVEFCLERGVEVTPGCSTPSEIQLAYKSGLRTVKFFPSEPSGGIAAIKLLAGPFAGLRFVPTGGITLDNLRAYLQCDKVAACGGSFMAPAALLEKGDFAGVTALCRKAVRCALGFELDHVGIYASDASNAEGIAWLLGNLLGVTARDEGDAFSVDGMMRCLKAPSSGEKGVIALRVSSLERATAWAWARGFSMREDDGATLVETVGGFRLQFVK